MADWNQILLDAWRKKKKKEYEWGWSDLSKAKDISIEDDKRTVSRDMELSDQIDKRNQAEEQKRKQDQEAERKRKEAEDRAKEKVEGPAYKSIWERLGDTFEANSPQDQAKRKAQNKPTDYKVAKSQEKEATNRNKVLNYSKDEINSRREYFKRQGVDIDKIVKDKYIFEKFKQENKGKTWGQVARENSKEYQIAQDYKKNYDKYVDVEESYNRQKSAKSGTESSAQQIFRNVAGGVADTYMTLPSNAQSLASNLLDVVSPEGSRLDKYAEERFRDAAKDNIKAKQTIEDKGIGQNEKDSFVGGTLARGAGSLVGSAMIGPGGEGTKAVGLWNNVKHFLKPSVVGTVFGVNKGGDIVREAKDKGAGDLQAGITSLAAGYAEGVLENWGLSKIFNNVGESVVKSVVENAITEGSQEFLQDIATSAIQDTYKDVDWSEAVAAAIQSGYTGAILGAGAGGVASNTTPKDAMSENLQKQGVPPEDAESISTAYDDKLKDKAVNSPPSATDVMPPEAGPSEIPGTNIDVPAGGELPDLPDQPVSDIPVTEVDSRGNDLGKTMNDAGVRQPVPTSEGGYKPSHPSYYKEGAPPLEPNVIIASAPEGKDVKLQKNETYEKIKAELDKDVKRYEEIRAKGADALSQYDRSMSGDQDAVATALSLKYSHIVYNAGRLKALDAKAKAPAKPSKPPVQNPPNVEQTGSAVDWEENYADKYEKAGTIIYDDNLTAEQVKKLNQKQRDERTKKAQAQASARQAEIEQEFIKKWKKTATGQDADEGVRQVPPKEPEKRKGAVKPVKPREPRVVDAETGKDMGTIATAPAPRKGSVKPVGKKKADTFGNALSVLEDRAQAKYGKPASKLSVNQVAEIMREGKLAVKAGIELVQKIGNPRKGYTVDDVRPVLVFGGKEHKIYTDGYIAIVDTAVADQVNDEIAKKEIKKRIKENQKRFPEATYADHQAEAEKWVAEQQKSLADQYPKIQKGTEYAKDLQLYKIAGDKGRVVGYYNDTGGSSTAVMTDGKITIIVNADLLAFMDKHFPGAQYNILGELKPIQVIVDGSVVGVVMPLKTTSRNGAPDIPAELVTTDKKPTSSGSNRNALEYSLEQAGQPGKPDEGRFREENARTADEMLDLINQLNKAGQINTILRLGGLRSKKALGQFEHGGRLKGKERLKLRDDVMKDPQKYMTVLAHELSHALEFSINGGMGKTLELFGTLNKTEKAQLVSELKEIVNNIEGKETAESKPNYYYKNTEMLARFIETMLLQPSKLAELAPLATNRFELAVLKHPELADLVSAVEGTFEKKRKLRTLFPDLEQIFKKHLGRRVGEKAFNNERDRRFMLQRYHHQLESLIKEKFKGVKDSQKDLFRAAESVLRQETDGTLVFGTKDYVYEYDKKDAQKRTLDGYEFVGVVDRKGEPAYKLARVRHTEEEGRKMFDNLTPEGQKLIKDFTAPASKATDPFNRNLISEIFNIDNTVEGWVHRGERTKPKGRMKAIITGKKTNFKEKTAGMKHERKADAGHLEDFKKQMSRSILEGGEEFINNKFIQKQLATISKPIAKGAEPDKGWVEVMVSKKGLIAPSDAGRESVTIITKEADGAPDGFMSMGGSQVIDQKTFLKPLTRVQVPKEMYSRYQSLHGLQEDMSATQRVLSNLANYWAINVLFYGGTVGTNFVGGALLYSGYLVEGFYSDLAYGLTEDPKQLTMPRTRARLAAPLQAFFQWNKVDSAIYGGVRSTFAGQFMDKGRAEGAIEKMGNILLTPFGAVENYWKKAITISEGGKNMPKGQLGKDMGSLSKAESKMVAEINKAVDAWALDYDNVNPHLDTFNQKGKLIKPFVKYPYKYTKRVAQMFAAPFDSTKSPQERTVALLTLATLMAMFLGLEDWRDDKRETPPGTAETPVGLSSKGRFFIGKIGENELFVRTAKYPFANLTGLGKQIIAGDYQDAADLLTDQLGTLAPISKSVLAIMGFKSQYDQYTETNAIIAKEFSSFIPGFRILNDIGDWQDPIKRTPQNWKQAIMGNLPTWGDEENKAKWRGKAQTIKVPNETTGVRSITDKTNTEKESVIHKSDILWAALTGVYITRVNPEDAKKQQLREKRNNADANIRALMKDHKFEEADKVAKEAGLSIPERSKDYYRKNY